MCSTVSKHAAFVCLCVFYGSAGTNRAASLSRCHCSMSLTSMLDWTGGGGGGVKPAVPDVCGALCRVAACICAGLVEENVFSRTAGAILTRSTQWRAEAFMAR